MVGRLLPVIGENFSIGSSEYIVFCVWCVVLILVCGNDTCIGTDAGTDTGP